MDQIVIERLEWDTNWFGFPIGRVRGPLVEELPESDCRCLYCLCEPGDASWAERNGFELIDVRVELDWSGSFPAPVGIREATTAEREDLQKIASDAFADSRFYQDSRFPRERVDAMFARWLEQSEVVLTDEECLGFITYERREEPPGDLREKPAAIRSVGHIGLVGVGEDARGKGLGERLVHAAQARCSSMTVVTQGKNIAAQRLYQKCGFRTSALRLWYHRWLR